MAMFYLSLLCVSNAQFPVMEPPSILQLVSNPLFILLVLLFFVVLMVLWIILPFAIFGIKKILRKTASDVASINQRIGLLEKVIRNKNE